MLFVPMRHDLDVPDTTWMAAMACVAIPYVALVVRRYHVIDRYTAKLVVIPIMALLVLHLVITNIHEPLTWAHLTTLITVCFLILLVDDPLAGVIMGAFLIGVFEIPYLLTRPLAGLDYSTGMLIQQCFLVLPFCFLRLRPTRWTAVLFVVWVALWVIWVVPLGRWEVTSGEPIQWIPYQLSKGIKLMIVPLLCTIKLPPCRSKGASVEGGLPR